MRKMMERAKSTMKKSFTQLKLMNFFVNYVIFFPHQKQSIFYWVFSHLLFFFCFSFSVLLDNVRESFPHDFSLIHSLSPSFLISLSLPNKFDTSFSFSSSSFVSPSLFRSSAPTASRKGLFTWCFTWCFFITRVTIE